MSIGESADSRDSRRLVGMQIWIHRVATKQMAGWQHRLLPLPTDGWQWLLLLMAGTGYSRLFAGTYDFIAIWI